MYVPSYLSTASSQTPKEYTNRARDEVARKLNLPRPAQNATTASRLKHGPSPLQRIASMESDTSLTKTNSNESLDTLTGQSQEQLQQQQPGKKVKGLFGSLLRRKNTGSTASLQSQEMMAPVDEDSMMADDTPMETVSTYEDMQPLHTVPSIDSVSTAPSTVSSYQSKQTTVADSLFSNQHSLATQFTNLSSTSYLSQTPHLPSLTAEQAPVKPTLLTLQEALPTRFDDMYAPELLADPNLLIDGRPMFTKRALLDWELNDIRSLLIVEKMQPEWQGQLPIIYSPPGFKFEFLPLDADDQTIVKTLVESDIYKEANLDLAFRIQTAKYTLHAARSRHAQILKSSGLPTLYNNRLSKAEWRNVIENFLLNLAVEAQCRADFKQSCSELKRLKKRGEGSNSLLRKAILNDVTQSTSSVSTKLTKEEKARLWTDVQSKVYKRLGLDWTPDRITS